MDIHMPVCDGIEATKIIRKLEHQSGKYIPIVALTAKAIKGDKDHYLSEGMDGYISKPINSEKLQNLLFSFLGKNDSERLQKAEEQEFIFDLQAVAENLGLEEEDTKELIIDFIDTIDEYLLPLEDAIDKNEFSNIQLYSHKLKGTAASYGFIDLFEKCKIIEDNSEKKKPMQYEELFADVVQESQFIINNMKQLFGMQ